MKSIFTIVVNILAINFVIAGYGCQGTILDLTLNSNRIFEGKLINIEKDIDEFGNEDISGLRIKIFKSIYGVQTSDTIVINYFGITVDNIEKRLTKDSVHIFFVYENKVGELYSNVCLMKSGEVEERNTVANKVISLIDISKIENESKRISKTIDWLIDCIKHPYTRWDGIEELSSRGVLYTYDKKTKRYKRIKKYKLTKSQKIEIRNCLLTKNRFQYNDTFLVDLVIKHNKNEILNKLELELRRTDLSKRIWFRELNLMRVISQNKNSKKLKDIMKKVDSIGIYSRDKKLISLTEEFINLM